MSEFERVRSAVPPFTPPARPEAYLPDDQVVSAGFDEPYQREGLPPGFRMRHDAHYVDQLTTRTAAPQVRLIPLRDIDAARPADDRDLGALSRSIGKYGILQPLLVRPRAGRFELIAGVRRLAAAAVAGLTEVPCLVHQVDDTRARALAESDNLRATEPAVVASAPADVPAAALTELSQSFGAIGSCLHLLADRDTALRDRVALDLVRTEVHRAGRLVRCLTAIGQDPSLSETDVSLSSAFEQVVDGFAPERRLSGATIGLDAGGRALPVARRSGVAGRRVGRRAGRHVGARAGRESAGPQRPLVHVGHARVADARDHPAGRDRAGVGARPLLRSHLERSPRGYQAAAEFAAARKVAELHRGGAEVIPGDRGGCRLLLLFPTV